MVFYHASSWNVKPFASLRYWQNQTPPDGLEAGLNQRRFPNEKNKNLNPGFAALLYD
jgi:hypothetical protein